jgi:hypothetical protein
MPEKVGPAGDYGLLKVGTLKVNRGFQFKLLDSSAMQDRSTGTLKYIW